MKKLTNEYRITIFFVLCMIFISHGCQTSFKIVPVREAEFREEHCLPLDKEEIGSILKFIAAGGVHRKSGALARLEVNHFQEFLQFFTEEANMAYGSFIALEDLEKYIDLKNPVKYVIDAREKEGSKGITRFAYRYKDFWFVFMIDKLSEDGKSIGDNERKFSRLIVMQVIDRKERIK